MLDIIHAILHLDVTISIWAETWGAYLYLILFLIIFCETGLVVTPFLPGDSLLFATGALAAVSVALELKYILPLLIIAALTGDSLNYFFGRKFGRNLFEKETFFFKKKYLLKTENFYELHGNKAVFMARFFPILRTFAPFVAGLGHMKYRLFFMMSFLGSLAWIHVFVLAGFFFGQIELVKKNFTYLIMALLILPALPIIIATLKSFRVKQQIK